MLDDFTILQQLYLQMYPVILISSSRQHNSKNRQPMTARGYCCYCYLEHCSKTNHIAIKEVIKWAKYENVFGLLGY